MPSIGIIAPKQSHYPGLKEILFKMKKRFGSSGIIVYTGGNDTGIEYEAKKIALSFNFEYKEFNPVYTKCGLYSIWAESEYNKPYSKHLELDRYLKMMNYIDYLMFFRSDKDPVYKHTLSQIEKRYPKIKKVVI